MKNNDEYKICSISKRIICNLINYLFLIILSVITNFLLLYFPFDWNLINKNLAYNHLLFSGMFTIGVSLSFIYWMAIFILSPLIFKGFSLGLLCTKTRFLWEEQENKFSKIIKHQGIAIIPIYLTLFLCAFISFAFDQPAQFISSVFILSPQKAISKGSEIACGIMIVFFIISCLFMAGNIINVILNRNYSTYLDESFGLFIIELEDEKKDEPIKEKKKKNKLPINIDEDELEKIT